MNVEKGKCPDAYFNYGKTNNINHLNVTLSLYMIKISYNSYFT